MMFLSSMGEVMTTRGAQQQFQGYGYDLTEDALSTRDGAGILRTNGSHR